MTDVEKQVYASAFAARIAAEPSEASERSAEYAAKVVEDLRA